MALFTSAEAKIMPLRSQDLIALILTMAIASNASIVNAKRPEPPKTGTPSGHTTPGTTRPETNCPTTTKPLTAIVANQGEDFTVEEYPTFLFYLPYSASEISLIEFLLLDETQTQTIYRLPVEPSQQPGIIKIQLPSNERQALTVNTTYHWRFNLDCEPDSTIVPDLVLQGWIRRVPLDLKTANQLKFAQMPKYSVYQRKGIWYDAIALLAESHFANPDNIELTRAWDNTLKSLKIDWLIGEPLVN